LNAKRHACHLKDFPNLKRFKNSSFDETYRFGAGDLFSGNEVVVNGRLFH